jgi:hypothetical protein
MTHYIKVTHTEENHSLVEYLIIYQIVSIAPDERHHQTFIKLGNGEEIKVIETVDQLLSQMK